MRYQSSNAVRAATGRGWTEWFELLDRAGARDMPHKDITAWLDAQGLVSGMWCQAVVTTYEQEIGRRIVGQTCDGDWTAGTRRVVRRCDSDEAFTRWCAAVDGQSDFDGVALDGSPTVQVSEKFRYWRAKLADGSRVDMNIYRNPRGEVSLNVSHKKLRSEQDSQRWKAYWKKRVAGLDL